MNTRTTLFLLLLFSFQLEAKEVSLDEAVNQVKSEGRVLSAKTLNGVHEIKVLTPSGTVKTFNQKASEANINVKPDRPYIYQKGGQSMYNKKRNPIIPNRFNNRKQQTRIKIDTRQMDLQPNNNRSRSNKSGNNNNNKNDKN